jgi:hypothetical protein
MLTMFVFSVCAVPGLIAAEREWQNGVWREATVERPRMTFGISTRDPNSSLPQAASAREVRRYVIDTQTQRLELRQDVTADTPRVDALVGGPVLFAIDKKTVYVKDGNGREHKLNLSKQSPLPK